MRVKHCCFDGGGWAALEGFGSTGGEETDGGVRVRRV